jgi:hypothetical protein
MEIGKVHELFCKRIMGMPSTAANGVCVREQEGKDKQEGESNRNSP